MSCQVSDECLLACLRQQEQQLHVASIEPLSLDATLEGVYRTPKTSLVSTGLSFVLRREETKTVTV